jgi:sugar phosphate isomerase/epimerase
LGLELMAFAYPTVLDGDWHSVVERYRPLLKAIRGPLSIHGPFFDMTSGSPDQRITDLVVERYHHALRIAGELSIETVVFHANFIASIRNQPYRQGWHEKNLHFWGPMADFAQKHGVTIAVENMWEFDPHIIVNVVHEINHPHLRVCLDVGHSYLFGDPEWTFDDWLAILQPYLIHVHLNNNDGLMDVHHGLHNGVLDYHMILDKLRALPTPPPFVLVVDVVAQMVESLPFLKLKETTSSLGEAKSR